MVKIKKSLVGPLECVHVDTCLPDYWGGHHLAHISVPIYRAHAAVEKIKPSKKGKRVFFEDVPIDEDADYSVYAYFVFREKE